jgi:GxxExxY protein
MPISGESDIFFVPQEPFSKIDYEVMGAAFAAHNELGRLFDEAHYAHFMRDHLTAGGHHVAHEYKISITFEDFQKNYYVDLLINNAVPYELKVVDEINRKHEAQALNYLYLCDLSHGKIINFRNPSVESRFISTTLRRQDRAQFEIEDSDWKECGSLQIKEILRQLLDDWGTHLSLEIYRQALAHFCCQQELSEQPLDIKTRSGHTGNIYLHRIDRGTFLYLTSNASHLPDHEKHLRKILEMTNQSGAQWIHFDKTHICLRTIRAHRR